MYCRSLGLDGGDGYAFKWLKFRLTLEAVGILKVDDFCLTFGGIALLCCCRYTVTQHAFYQPPKAQCVKSPILHPRKVQASAS
jgi:hypothetical protein